MRTRRPILKKRIEAQAHLVRKKRDYLYARWYQTTNGSTFSETRLLLPFRSSGAIHGSVPRTPPEISVLHFTFDRPKSPTWSKSRSEKPIQ
jgi:hypothetical protein